MLLCHGSNACARAPRLFASDRRADFGTGFHHTSSRSQATRWARLVARRRASGTPQVSAFEYDEDASGSLRVLRFDGATVEWLAFVGADRRGEQTAEYDIVCGPVANDNTMPTLGLFFAGVYSEREATKRPLPQRLRVQCAFKTREALGTLTFCEVTGA